MNFYYNYTKIRTKIKVFALKWLVLSLSADALKHNNHELADKTILLTDALQGAGWMNGQ